MQIKRDLYLNKLIDAKGNGFIKVITGVRRCGKSYLLNSIFREYLIKDGIKPDHIISFSFDSAEDLALIGEDVFAANGKTKPVDPKKFMAYIASQIIDDDMFYLLLDEVQLLGSFEAVLNSYLRKPNMDVYVTGSNAKFLSKDVITEFAGRGDEIALHPLSFAEFMSQYEGDKRDGLTEYMMYGGIPLVALEKNPQNKVKILNSLFEEIYIKDMLTRYNIRHIEDLNTLLNIVSSAVGSLTNPEKLKNTFRSAANSKITSSTVIKYLSYLEDSFLISSADRYDVKGKSYISTPKKYYFTDTGLRNVRINFRQFEKTHLMENIIYNELCMRGYNVDVGVVPIHTADSTGKSQYKQLEIDFVCNMGSERYYIQSAYAIPDIEKRKQEILPFTRVGDSFKKILVTGDNVPTYYDDNGILTMNVIDFLLGAGL